MTDFISREDFLADKRRLYCENCDRRKGTKNGKTKCVYEIGDAPCRSCGIGDVLDDVEEYPAADVAPVVRCRECIWHDERGNRDGKGYCQRPRLRGTSDRYGYCYGSETPADWYCADGERKEDKA